MTIEELLKRPIGKEYRTGGFQLTVKRSRSVRESGKKYLQEVLFLDSTGEMNGEVLLPKYVPLQNSANINIIICWNQTGEKKAKLYVEQWSHVQWSAEGFEASRNHSIPDDYDIEGRCLTWHIAAFIEGYTAKTGQLPECNEDNQTKLRRWVKFNCSYLGKK